MAWHGSRNVWQYPRIFNMGWHVRSVAMHLQYGMACGNVWQYPCNLALWHGTIVWQYPCNMAWHVSSVAKLLQYGMAC